MATVEVKRFSPQQVWIAVGATENFDLVKVPAGQVFFLQKFDFHHLAEQGKQDLLVTLKQGSQIVYHSGKEQVIDPNYPPENRSASPSGWVYSEISSSTGMGYPDNFPIFDKNFPVAIDENQTLTCAVKNQSAVYDHALVIDFSGFLSLKKR